MGDSGSDVTPFEATDEGPRDLGVGPAKVAAIDAEHLRNAVAARLFGAAADPVKIGRFTVIERLGAGGMGVVYSAYDNELDRKIAVKLLRRVDQTGAHHARLTREAQALARLSHPNVVQVFELGSFRGQTFVAMEFIDGQTLREWSPPDDEDPLTATLGVFEQAAKGLAAAHAAGLVHRDFKPDNVLVGRDGRVRVVDFGLARGGAELERDSSPSQNTNPSPRPKSEADDERPSSLNESGDSFNQPLTRTGDILGTPAYMAPEQHLGQTVDARTDQFAFCVALWEQLYGERPFAGRGIVELTEAVVHGRVRGPAPDAPAVPVYVRRALERGLSVDPRGRWPDMPSLMAALRTDPRRRRRRVMGIAIAATMTVAAAGLWLARDEGPGPCDGGERELQGIWDPGVRGRVERAFRATEAPYASDAWTGTARHLDAFADEWVATHREVCEDSMVRGQDNPELIGRKMVCLGQRLTELEQLTHVLEEADIDIVSRAVVAASSLQPIAECTKADALVDLPSDDPRASELARLLVSASGRKALGKYDEGVEIADQALALARELESARGEGQALLLLGELQAKLRKSDDAKQTLRMALRRADVAGDDETRVRALNQLMWVAYLQADLDAGEAASQDARAALERLGDAPLLEADFLLYSGLLAQVRGDNEAAAEQFARTVAIRQRELGEDHPEVAISKVAIAQALSRSGQWERAEAEARRALAIFESTLGATHPYIASSHNSIGNSLFERARHLEGDDPERARTLYTKATEHYTNAVDVRELNYGTSRPDIALNLHNLGETQRRLGDHARARQTLERCLAIKLEHMGEDHPSVATTRTGLGRSLLALGEHEAALAMLELAAANRRTHPRSPDANAETYFALGEALALARPDDEDARARALAVAEDARAAYEAAGADYRRELDEVVAWIDARAPQ